MKSVIGLDFTSLYLFCISLPNPTGLLTRWLTNDVNVSLDSVFQRVTADYKDSSYVELEYITYMQAFHKPTCRDHFILSRYRGFTVPKIGYKQVKVDGLCVACQRIYDFKVLNGALVLFIILSLD